MQLILPVLTGLLMALSMPGPDLGWLVWIGLVPLLLALRDKTPKQAFRLSFVAGFAFGLVIFYWVYALWEWVSVLTIPSHLGLAAYLGIFYGLFGWGFAHLRERIPDWSLALALPALWVILEFARSLTIFGFPWAQAADALTTHTLLPYAQVAAHTGIWGASFSVVLINVLLFLFISRGNYTYLVTSTTLFVVLYIGGFLWGGYEAEGEEVTVALLQTSIPQTERTDPTRLYEHLSYFQTFLEVIETRINQVDLVVLPESALPAFIFDQDDLRDYFTTWANTHQTPILIGSFTTEFIDNQSRVYNSVAYIDTSGSYDQIYSKIQLVPFSTEYFPGIKMIKSTGVTDFFPMIGRLGRISPGDSYSPLETSLGNIGTPICFETIFPHISREFARSGAQVLMTVTNDAWFHNTWALPQHFRKGVYRAIENRRYFVQTANSGISGVISPEGEVLTRSVINDRVITYGNFRLLNNETLYMKYGDWFVYLCMLMLLAAVGASRLSKRGGRSESPASSAE